MSYTVFARKYRPQTFEDLIGQDAMVRTLRNAFESGRILVSAARTRRFRALGFSEVRNSVIGGRHLLMRRF